MHSLRVSSALRAPPAEVWAHAATIEGVNAELAPFARMTSPGADAIREGALGRSWILLGGGLQALVFEAAFGRRHRRLRALWGAA